MYEIGSTFAVNCDNTMEQAQFFVVYSVSDCVCMCIQFIQWNIHRCGVKQSEQVLPQDATGPFVLSGYSGYKQVSPVTMEISGLPHRQLQLMSYLFLLTSISFDLVGNREENTEEITG